MGTNGLYAYRHRGIYYIIYNHYDSQPGGLGQDLVATIPTDEEAFKAWLENLRAFYDNEPLRIEKLLSEGTSCNVDGINRYFGYDSKPSEKITCRNLWIEYVYVFDLDRLAFSVDNGAHFKLDNVPRGGEHPSWIRFLHVDALRRRCLSPTTPREYIADMSPEAPRPSEDGLAVYDECQPKLITPSELAPQSMDTSEKLALCLANDFIRTFYSFFSNLTEKSDREFSHIAAGLLYAASPGLAFITADSFAWAPSPLSNTSSPNVETSDGFQMYFPPETGFEIPHQQFWYRGRLIRFTRHLHIEENLKAEIGAVVKSIRTKAMAECLAILLSVRHVVFVTVSRNDVARTAAIPIMDAFGHGTLEATLQRLSVGLGLLVQHLRPPASDTKSIILSLGSHEDVDPSKPTLPLDVVTHILRFVDDETYVCCRSLARAYRVHCIGLPRVGRYTLLRHTAENRFVARLGDGPNVNVKITWSRFRPRSTHYAVYILYEEEGYLTPLRLSKGDEIGVTLSIEGED